MERGELLRAKVITCYSSCMTVISLPQVAFPGKGMFLYTYNVYTCVMYITPGVAVGSCPVLNVYTPAAHNQSYTVYTSVGDEYTHH